MPHLLKIPGTALRYVMGLYKGFYGMYLLCGTCIMDPGYGTGEALILWVLR